MAYALHSQEKIVLTGVLNCIQLQQVQRSDEQLKLATSDLSLRQEVTSMNASLSQELSNAYEALSLATDSDTRASINAAIESAEADFEAKLDKLNRKIYEVSMKETAIEMEVKRLDTKLTALNKRLEKIQEAEGTGIDHATPQFNGIG